MIITTPTGKIICIRPKCGGLQGDSIMATMFRAAYDEKMQEWIKEKQTRTNNRMSARDPITGEWIHVGTTAYADDVGDTNIVQNAIQAIEIIKEQNELLDEQLETMGLKQNADKETRTFQPQPRV